MNPHVLFVDDDPSFVGSLCRMLHPHAGEWTMTLPAFREILG